MKINENTKLGADGVQQNAWKRGLMGVPVALFVTAGLGVFMANMIRVEYQTLAEKPEKLSFTINEQVADISPVRDIEIPVLRTVEVPPPPPTSSIDGVDEPTTKRVDLEFDPPTFDKPDVEFEPASFKVSNRDVQPIFRAEPVMPPRFMEGDNSGHCNVRFDVSAQGSPYNVVATYCTAKVLERATVKSVLKWKFRAKVVNGQEVAMTGVENKVTFRLLDERGNELPEI